MMRRRKELATGRLLRNSAQQNRPKKEAARPTVPQTVHQIFHLERLS
jgi:hypothetical protein